jgi:hypothetical protein
MSRRRKLWILGTLIASLTLVYILGRPFLGSRLTLLLQARLSALYGGPVELEHASIGFSSSVIQGVKLFEAGTSLADAPWASVAEVNADVSVLNLLAGQVLPKQLNLGQATVVLRFDADGRLQTRLPESASKIPYPDFHMEQGRIILRQEGREDFEVAGVVASLHQDGDLLSISGTADDAYWGSWTVSGTLDRGTSRTSIQLSTAERHVTQDMLNKLPFVKPSVWQQVQCEGDTAADITIVIDPGAKDPAEKVSYTVAIQPEATKVHVSSIDFDADQVQGRLTVKDAVVAFRAEGHTADGRLRTDSTMDFRIDPNILKFKIDAFRLQLRKLPKSWRIPGSLDALLSGEANLDIRIVQSTAEPRGRGAGRIENAKLAGIPLPGVMGLKLSADGKRFHFTPTTPVTRPSTGRSNANSIDRGQR